MAIVYTVNCLALNLWHKTPLPKLASKRNFLEEFSRSKKGNLTRQLFSLLKRYWHFKDIFGLLLPFYFCLLHFYFWKLFDTCWISAMASSCNLSFNLKLLLNLEQYQLFLKLTKNSENWAIFFWNTLEKINTK